MSAWELLKAPGVAIVLFIYTLNMMMAIAFTAVVPVFEFTSPELGGYGFSPLQISLWLASAGVFQMLWCLFVFPPWQRRVGTGRVLRVLYLLYPLSMVVVPIPSILRRTHHEAAFWATLSVGLVLCCGMAMTFSESRS